MSLSKRFGVALAVIHLCLFLVFITYIHLSENDGQLPLLWTLWLPVDFPISLIVILGLDVIPSDENIGSLLRFALPYFVHGVIGTIWWFFIPTILAAIFRKISGSGTVKKE